MRHRLVIAVLMAVGAPFVAVACSGSDDASSSSSSSSGGMDEAGGGESSVGPGGEGGSVDGMTVNGEGGPGDSGTAGDAADGGSTVNKRGFPTAAPWLSFYGNAADMADLNKVALTFRIINVDVDPSLVNFTPAQITQLKAGGQNRVISYFNIGACESFRSYWTTVPAGFVSCNANTAAKLGAYNGFPTESWMNPANADYQHLIVDHVAARLAATGVDGFFLDNLEIVEHSPTSTNGPCNAACKQGGLDLVRKLRAKFPDLLFVMQNATGDETRLGVTGGVAFPTLLDGLSHEDVYLPTYQPDVETEIGTWKSLGLTPGGHPFWIGTEDYVGNCTNTAAAASVYTKSKAKGFSPYATDDTGGQRVVCYWP